MEVFFNDKIFGDDWPEQRKAFPALDVRALSHPLRLVEYAAEQQRY